MSGKANAADKTKDIKPKISKNKPDEKETNRARDKDATRRRSSRTASPPKQRKNTKREKSNSSKGSKASSSEHMGTSRCSSPARAVSPETKAPRSSSPAPPDSPDLLALLSKSEKKVLSAVATAQDEFSTNFKALESSTKRRFAIVHTEISSVKHEQTNQAKQITEIDAKYQTRFAEMEKQLHMLSIETPLKDSPGATSSSRPWDGPIDETILRVETHARTEISLQSLKAYLDALYVDANIDPAHFTVEGSDLATRFIIQFQGAAGLAKRRLSQAVSAHREKTGKYKELSLADPLGSATRIYINPDENPQQIQTRRQTKSLGKQLRDAYPSIKLFVKQADGRICIGWSSLVSLVPSPNNSPPKLQWNLTLAQSNSVDAPAAQTRFLNSLNKEEEVEWSSI